MFVKDDRSRSRASQQCSQLSCSFAQQQLEFSGGAGGYHQSDLYCYGTSETTQNTESPPVRHLYQHSHQPGSLVPALCFLKLNISFNYRLYETIEDLRETISRENTLLAHIKLVFFILYRFDIILDMSSQSSLSVHLSFVLALKQRPLNIFPSPYFIKLTLWN